MSTELFWLGLMVLAFAFAARWHVVSARLDADLPTRLDRCEVAGCGQPSAATVHFANEAVRVCEGCAYGVSGWVGADAYDWARWEAD